MSSGSIRIIQLPEKSSVNTDDYMAVDSSANGTKKIKFTDLLDDNLSAQNKAADAQATGEAISELNTNINNTNTRIDNMINTQQNASVTTLWTGSLNAKNQTATLSESIANFDFIDIYIGDEDTVFARKPVSSSVHFEIQTQNMSDDASAQFLRWYETGLTISGTTATIDKAIRCYWDDFSQHPVVAQAIQSGITIMRIDGVKIGHVENDEIVDARVGADGVTYPTLGDAIRGQVTDLKSDLSAIQFIGDADVPITSETFLYANEPTLTETYTANGVQLVYTATANPLVYYSVNDLIVGHKYLLEYTVVSGNINSASQQKMGTVSGTTFTSIPTDANKNGNVFTLEFTATSASQVLRISMIYSSKDVTIENFHIYEYFVPSEIENQISELKTDIAEVKYLSVVNPPITSETFLSSTEPTLTETYITGGVQLAFTATANPILYYAISDLIIGHKYKLNYKIASGELGDIGNQSIGIWSNNSFTSIPNTATLNNGIVTLEFIATATSHALRIVMIYSSKNVTLVDFNLYDIFDPQITEKNDVTIHLPDKYYAVVGDTFELFYKGIINCIDPDLYYVQVICPKGNAYKHKFIYTPTAEDVGTVDLTVQVFDGNHTFLDEKATSIIVKAKATSPISEKVILWVGDSLSVAGVAPSEFYRRLTGNGGSPSGDSLANISMIGTRDGTNGAKYVAEGGWTFNSYNTANETNSVMWITTSHDKTQADQHSIYKDGNNAEWKLETVENGKIKIMRLTTLNALPPTGTLIWVSGGENHSDIVYTASEQAAGNPFWNTDTSSVDFEMFVTEQGKSSLDYVYVLLGWNSLDVAKETYKSQVETFISNVLADYPTCKIVLLGLEVPSLDGLGNNYAANTRFSYYFNMNGVWRMEEVYKEIASSNANVTYTQVSGQFDTVHNMQQSTRVVNTRNPETEVYQTNGVHPANYGYLQIADVAYRECIVNELQ